VRSQDRTITLLRAAPRQTADSGATNGRQPCAARSGGVDAGRTRCTAFVLTAIVALAALVRFNHLADPSCTFDEGFCWKLTTFGFDQVWHRVASDNHPPLFFYLLLFWRSLFGDSLAGMRALSVLIGLAGVVAAYLFVKEAGTTSPPGGVHSPLSPLLAAGLMALSPFQIDWSQQIRMYALASTLTLFTSWLLLWALSAKTPRWQQYGAYALSAALLAYTHYFGLFIIGAHFLYATGRLFYLQADGTGNQPRLATAAHVLCAFCTVGILWLPWLPEFLRHREQVVHSFWTKQFEWEQLATVCYRMFEACWVDAPQAAWVSWTACEATMLFSAAALVFGRGGLRLAGLAVVLTFGSAAMASLCSRNIVVPHYFILCHALLVCGIAIAVWRWPIVHPEAASLALFLLFTLLCCKHAERREARASFQGMRAAMAYLADVRKGDEPVLVSNPMLQVVASTHALHNESVQVLSSSDAFPYYQGTAVVRLDDYISPRILRQRAAERLWIIDAVNWNGGTWRALAPDLWVDVAEEDFPDGMSPSSRIIVRRCERRRPAGLSGDVIENP
jgi:hypothetical protein